MKKVCLIIFALVGFATTQAQYQVNSFFPQRYGSTNRCSYHRRLHYGLCRHRRLPTRHLSRNPIHQSQNKTTNITHPPPSHHNGLLSQRTSLHEPQLHPSSIIRTNSNRTNPKIQRRPLPPLAQHPLY